MPVRERLPSATPITIKTRGQLNGGLHRQPVPADMVQDAQHEVAQGEAEEGKLYGDAGERDPDDAADELDALHHVGEPLLGVEIAGLQPSQAVKHGDGVVEPMARGVCPAESAQGLRVLRLAWQTLAVIIDRRVASAEPGAIG